MDFSPALLGEEEGPEGVQIAELGLRGHLRCFGSQRRLLLMNPPI